MPIKKPRSAKRVTINAFLDAATAEGLSIVKTNQQERRNTYQFPENIDLENLEESTSPSMEKVNSERKE